MVFILLFFGLCDTCFAENGEKTAGNWLEIASTDDPAVINVGRFAVNEHNKVTNSTMMFERVVKGDSQIVGGMNWRLTIEVKDHKTNKTCEVLVYQPPAHKPKKLVSFKIV